MRVGTTCVKTLVPLYLDGIMPLFILLRPLLCRVVRLRSRVWCLGGLVLAKVLSGPPPTSAGDWIRIRILEAPYHRGWGLEFRVVVYGVQRVWDSPRSIDPTVGYHTESRVFAA